MSEVLLLPPRASCRIRVSFESRYGTCFFWSASDLMTCPSAESDWLIFMASSRVWPFAPVLPTFSLPARSTRFRRPARFDP